MRQQPLIPWVVSLFAGLALAPVLSQAQEVFKIDQLVRSNGVVSIQFTDSRSAALATTRALDATASLNPPINWTNASGAVFSSLGGSQYLVTAPALADFSFYRIVDLGALDRDGDGVPDAVEVALGTNPNVPDWIQDTDGDGYSDGLEIVNGSSPTNATSRILRGLQPEVQFVQTTSRTIESAGTYSVPFQFKSNYSGVVYYSISVMSTATNGVDFTHSLNGVVTVQGGAGSIPLNIIDDLVVEDMEAIVLVLEDDVAGTYHTGAFQTHTVLLIDNDANWSGLMQSSVGETSFRLCVLRASGQVSAMLIPSSKATTNHPGGQVIPLPPPGQDGWPVTNLLLTATEFTGQSVPLPAGSSRLLGQVPLVRTLSFSAVPPPPGVTNVLYLSKTNASFGPLVIAGEYDEVVAAAQPGNPFLQFTNRGNFALSREAPVMTPLQIPTTPAP
jgi:hypothetical protein